MSHLEKVDPEAADIYQIEDEEARLARVRLIPASARHTRYPIHIDKTCTGLEYTAYLVIRDGQIVGFKQVMK